MTRNRAVALAVALVFSSWMLSAVAAVFWSPLRRHMFGRAARGIFAVAAATTLLVAGMDAHSVSAANWRGACDALVAQRFDGSDAAYQHQLSDSCTKAAKNYAKEYSRDEVIDAIGEASFWRDPDVRELDRRLNYIVPDRAASPSGSTAGGA